MSIAAYDSLVKELTDAMGDEDKAELERVKKAYEGTDADALEEYWCNRFGELLENPEALRKFSLDLELKDAGLGRRVLIHMREFIRSILDRMGGKDTLQERRLRRADQMVGKILDNLERGEAREQGMYIKTGMGGNKYSLSEDITKFNGYLEAYRSDNLAEHVALPVVSEMPEVYGRISAAFPELKIAPGGISLYSSVLDKATGKKKSNFSGDAHDVTLEALSDLPENLHNPVMVFKGKTTNSLEILTMIKDQSGRSVMAVVQLNDVEGHHSINRIATIFGKDNVNYYVNRLKNGEALYVNEKRARNWSLSAQVQSLGEALLKASSGHTVIDFDENATMGVKNSATPVEDAAYMKAVQDGDMGTAQEMVNSIVKKIGGVFHRGKSPNETEYVIEWADDADRILSYGEHQYAHLPEHLVEIPDWVYEYAREYYNAYETPESRLRDDVNPRDIVGTAGVWDDPGFVSSLWAEHEGEFEDLLDSGVVGFKTTDGAVSFPQGKNGHLFKSADAVTYDDAGNVIPLSQRFNPANDDIRYSVSENPETAPEPSDLDAVSAFYAPDQVTQIATFLKPVVMNYGADAIDVARQWLEMNKVHIARPQDVDYVMN